MVAQVDGDERFPTAGCPLAIRRFAVMLPKCRCSMNGDDWFHHGADGSGTPEPGLIEHPRRAAKAVRMTIKAGLGYGAHTIPALMFHDMGTAPASWRRHQVAG